jgi:heterodisulfide reductase subunit A-like polyferredoxin
MANKKQGAVLIVGGGIGGMQASLDLVELGFKVYLLESKSCIGGVMAQLDKTFPTNDCSMCIMAPKLVEVGRNPNIELLTYSELEKVEGEAGNFTVHIRKHPKYVDPEKCTACGLCAQACPVEVFDNYNERLIQRNAISILYPQGIPAVYYIDKEIPQCTGNCPANTNARDYVNLVADGRFLEAIQLVKETNPLPAICGRICHHPCEEACKRGFADTPISIRQIKRFAADYEFEKGLKVEPIKQTKKEKIAIVGSGPAGLTAAHDLVKRGYGVTIFESASEPGGWLRYGIPAYRLPKDVLKREIDNILALGVELKTNTEIKEFNPLLKDYNAVLLAIGLQKGKKLPRVPGTDLDEVIIGIPFLRALNEGNPMELHGKVLIIGGGNVAIDCARSAVRLGADDVHVACLESRKEMPAHEWEIEEALEEGITLHCSVGPKAILGKDGKVMGLECLRVKSVFDPDGRFNPKFHEGTEFKMDCDMIIIAIGQDADFTVVGDKIKTTPWGTIKVDPDTMATNMDKVFAAGDIVNGPASAIEAIATGHSAAITIDRYLQGEDLLKDRPRFISVEPDVNTDQEVARKEVESEYRKDMPKISLEQRLKSFDEIELPYTQELVVEEAKRCLSCRRCLGCALCADACEADAIDFNQKEEMVKLNVGSIVLTPGFDEFDANLKPEYGYDDFPNVLSSIEFERILSATGPYAGTVLRPSDGKVPKKIAWLQCVGSRDSSIGNDYCSSVCCTYAVKEAVIAKEHIAQGLDATIFFMDMRTHGKDFDKYYERAENEHGVKFVRSRVAYVEEVPGTHDLLIKYEAEDGQIKEEIFDIVVLSVGLCAPYGSKQLSRKLGIDLNRYSFAKTNESTPLQTSRPGIYVAGAYQAPKDIPETVYQSSGAAAEASALLASARGTQVVTKEYPEERDVAGEEPRIGCFICHCGINIGGYLDVDAVTNYAKSLPNVVYAENNLFTCSTDTQQRMIEAIKEHNLNRVIVASCTPRTHEPLFQETLRDAGLNPHLFEMANIRDQCSWIHMKEPEKATNKAKDLVRMAVAKARLIEPLPTFHLDVNQSALIIGGGLAGMVAAEKIAEQGFDAYLIEKEKELGGNLRELYYTLDGLDVQALLKEKKEKLEKDPKAHIYTSAQIENIDGYIGNYVTTIKTNNKEEKLEHGVIIVATGAKESTPKEYLYGEDDKVVTQLEFEKKIAGGEIEKKKPKTVAMIQCVGSRDEERPYCSRVCCADAIKNALKITEQSPETDIYILYRDIRTYGFKEIHYEEARRKGIKFIRYDKDDKPKVSKDNKGLKIEIVDPILQKGLRIRPDYLVLSAAIEPRIKENEELSKLLKIPLNDEKFFLEAHVKLRPVDFPTEGVFLAGMAHNPKSIEETIAQAGAAAARACTIISKDKYEAEAAIAVVNEDVCDGCGICEPVCEYGAIEIITETVDGKELKKAKVTEALCKGCGGCVAACPSGAMEQKGFKSNQVLAMIDAALEEVAL